MSRRLAAYAVCIENDRVLLARYVHPGGDGTWWTLPGGGVEQNEDPYDAVIREVAEETGCEGVVERLLGVDSRVIPAAQARHTNGREDHQNIGIYYGVRITAGTLRPEPNGETAESVWTPVAEVPNLHRSSLVDVGLTLAQTRPPSGHLEPLHPDPHGLSVTDIRAQGPPSRRRSRRLRRMRRTHTGAIVRLTLGRGSAGAT